MLYHLYSGQLFLSSLATVVMVVALDLTGAFARSGLLRSMSRVVTLVAVALAALAATPVSLWLAIPGIVLMLAYLAIGTEERPSLRAAAGMAAIVVAIACAGLEARHQMTDVKLERPSRLVILGDSLSSGGFGEARAWPEILCAGVGCGVVNLSRPGDTVAAGVDGQLPDLPPGETGDLVIIELGGNDMLEGVPSRAYTKNLATLSGTVAAGGRRTAMFELPLLPGRWAYGAAQRRIASRHGIVLIPRRVLAGILLDPANTSDGLHLTQQGHEKLAGAVADWAGW